MRILMEDGVRTRDIATYKSPWVNTGVGRYSPTRSKVRPCALLIVIAKARRMGNCVRLNCMAECSSVAIRLMRGISTMAPMLTPVAISASRIKTQPNLVKGLALPLVNCQSETLWKKIGELWLIWIEIGENLLRIGEKSVEKGNRFLSVKNLLKIHERKKE